MPTPSRLASKESEIDYSIIGTGQLLPKLVATLEAGNPGHHRLGSGAVQLYRSQGHLLDVTDLVEDAASPGGLFPVSVSTVMHQGRAYGIPQSVSPDHWSPAWISSKLPK